MEKVLCILHDTQRAPAIRDRSIISESHDSGIFHRDREEITKPHFVGVRMYPGIHGMTTKTMDRNNTKGK